MQKVGCAMTEDYEGDDDRDDLEGYAVHGQPQNPESEPDFVAYMREHNITPLHERKAGQS